MNNIKLSKKIIDNIIKEEVLAAKKRYIKESAGMSSVSSVEIEELLRTYFHKSGGVPKNIWNLSVLFPVLESIGLEDLVDAYMESKKTGSPDPNILKDIKSAILSIQEDVFE